jgi:hypothetical protein
LTGWRESRRETGTPFEPDVGLAAIWLARG